LVQIHDRGQDWSNGEKQEEDNVLYVFKAIYVSSRILQKTKYSQFGSKSRRFLPLIIFTIFCCTTAKKCSF